MILINLKSYKNIFLSRDNILYECINGDYSPIQNGRIIYANDCVKDIPIIKTAKKMDLFKPKKVEEILKKDIKQGEAQVKRYQEVIRGVQKEKALLQEKLELNSKEAQELRRAMSCIDEDLVEKQADLSAVFDLVIFYKNKLEE